MSITVDTVALTHAGRGFSIATVTSIAGGGSLTFIGVPGAVDVHFHDMAFDSSAGPVLIEFIEAPTVSVQGTPAVAYNRRRASDIEPTLSIYTGGTVTGGTVIAYRRIFGDSTGSKAAAGEGVIRGEWDLDSSKTYTIKLTNETDPPISIDISADMSFYEIKLRDNYDVVPTYER